MLAVDHDSQIGPRCNFAVVMFVRLRPPNGAVATNAIETRAWNTNSAPRAKKQNGAEDLSKTTRVSTAHAQRVGLDVETTMPPQR